MVWHFFGNKCTIIIGVHVPNNDQQELWTDISLLLTEEDTNIVLLRDYNAVLDASMDTSVASNNIISNPHGAYTFNG